MNICSKNERKTVEYFLETANKGRMVIAIIVAALTCILTLPVMIPVAIMWGIILRKKIKQIIRTVGELDRTGMFNKFCYDELVIIANSMALLYTKQLYNMTIKFDSRVLFPIKIVYKDFWKYIKRYTFANIYDVVEEFVCKPIFTVH
jgi:hypothetical protein